MLAPSNFNFCNNGGTMPLGSTKKMDRSSWVLIWGSTGPQDPVKTLRPFRLTRSTNFEFRKPARGHVPNLYGKRGRLQQIPPGMVI